MQIRRNVTFVCSPSLPKRKGEGSREKRKMKKRKKESGRERGRSSFLLGASFCSQRLRAQEKFVDKKIRKEFQPSPTWSGPGLEQMGKSGRGREFERRKEKKKRPFESERFAKELGLL